MPRAIMMAFSQPTNPGMEDRYNDWYDNVHLKDVLDIPGITSATRYKLSDTQQSKRIDATRHAYLAVYDVEADDIQSVIDEIGSRARTPRMEISDAISMADTKAVIYELLD
jgi:hypothetical protein